MSHVPYPFAGRCLLAIANPKKPAVFLEAELALSPEEIYQCFRYREEKDYKRPMVLLFPEPEVHYSVQSDFSFFPEFIWVKPGGIIHMTHLQESAGLPNLYYPSIIFRNMAMAIVAMRGFCKKYNVVRPETIFHLFDCKNPAIIPNALELSKGYN